MVLCFDMLRQKRFWHCNPQVDSLVFLLDCLVNTLFYLLNIFARKKYVEFRFNSVFVVLVNWEGA